MSKFRDATKLQIRIRKLSNFEHFSASKSVEFCDGFPAALNGVCKLDGQDYLLYLHVQLIQEACMSEWHSAMCSPSPLSCNKNQFLSIVIRIEISLKFAYVSTRIYGFISVNPH